jgi:hypothetical protein
MSRKLFVGGLTNLCVEEELERAFSHWNPIDGKKSHDSLNIINLGFSVL